MGAVFASIGEGFAAGVWDTFPGVEDDSTSTALGTGLAAAVTGLVGMGTDSAGEVATFDELVVDLARISTAACLVFVLSGAGLTDFLGEIFSSFFQATAAATSDQPGRDLHTQHLTRPLRLHRLQRCTTRPLASIIYLGNIVTTFFSEIILVVNMNGREK